MYTHRKVTNSLNIAFSYSTLFLKHTENEKRGTIVIKIMFLYYQYMLNFSLIEFEDPYIVFQHHMQW
jgi:hypothetical protein